ncbi:MAG: 23S rRNA (adenine(2503)-C(2))-methyltransferase RlmN [Verrucomicrobia bacterium]|nr:23S rRNA (adenine(2503)-C(2))-methyltransferase RlmN [Verrucomicrobiota bacterium]
MVAARRSPVTTALITSCLREELQARLVALGQPAYRASQVLHGIYRRRARDFAGLSDLPAALRAQLAAEFVFPALTLVRVLGARDTTQKFLFRLSDGQLIESVLIPASPALYGEASDRRTLCVSSQVGCAYGCKFCASGLDGWTRNLQAGEIVEQVLQAEALGGNRVDNLVFMGMGEPLANFDNLLRAIAILNDAEWGLGLGARRMTVSTSGLAPQIRQLADQPRQIRLAISLHGATDEVRSQIMPVNRKYPLAALLDACRYWRSHKKQRLTFEFILIADLNDSPAQAQALAALANELAAKVNLIPYNTVAGLPWLRPPEARCEAFLRTLRARGVAATLRREKGHDINAACGQLRRQTMQGENGG